NPVRRAGRGALTPAAACAILPGKELAWSRRMGIGWTDRAGVVAAILVAAATLAPPAPAFEGLEQAVAPLPEDTPETGSGWVFDFAAPRITDELGINSVSVGRAQLATAILNPFPARALTGIDFRGLDAVLVFGDLPADLVYLASPRIDGDEVAEALTARGFE